MVRKATKKRAKNNSVGAGRNRNDEVLTRGKLIPMFEDIKDLITSTAKGTETRLGKRIAGVASDVKTLQVAVSEHGRMIKGLEAKIESTEERLSDKIDSIHVRVDGHEGRITAIEQAHH